MQKIYSAIAKRCPKQLASVIGVTILGFALRANAYPELKYSRLELDLDVYINACKKVAML